MNEQNLCVACGHDSHSKEAERCYEKDCLCTQSTWASIETLREKYLGESFLGTRANVEARIEQYKKPESRIIRVIEHIESLPENCHVTVHTHTRDYVYIGSSYLDSEDFVEFLRSYKELRDEYNNR